MIAFEFVAFLTQDFFKHPERLYNNPLKTGYVYDPYLAFRSINYPQQDILDQQDETSLFILGGSTALGKGVRPNEKTIFGTFEEKLAKDQILKPKNIINLATAGYVARQETASYIKTVFQLNKAPRAVISFTGAHDLTIHLINDIPLDTHEHFYEFNYVINKGYPPAEVLIENLQNGIRRTFTFGLYKILESKLLNEPLEPIYLNAQFKPPYKMRKEPPSQEIISQAAKNFTDACLITATLAKSRGTKYIVVLQPFSLYTTTENQYFYKYPGVDARRDAFIKLLMPFKTSFDQYYELVLNQLKAYQKQGLLEVWDYRNKLNGAGPVFFDHIHFSTVGAQLVGESLAEDFKKLKLKK